MSTVMEEPVKSQEQKNFDFDNDPSQLQDVDKAVQELQKLHAIKYRVRNGFNKTRKLDDPIHVRMAETLGMNTGELTAFVQIFDKSCPHIRRVAKARAKVENYIESRTIPYAPEPGIRLLLCRVTEGDLQGYLRDQGIDPEQASADQRVSAEKTIRSDRFEQFMQGLDNEIVEMKEVLDDFNQNHYAGVIEQRKEALGPQFKPENYGTSLSILVEVREVSITPPSYMMGISPELKRRAFQQLRDDVEIVRVNLTDNLVHEIQGHLERLIARMSGNNEEGRKQALRKSLLDNLQQDVNYFHEALKQNHLSTEQLDDLMGRVRVLVKSAPPIEELRDTSDASVQRSRELLADSGKVLFDMLNDALVSRPKRSLDLSKFQTKNSIS